MNKVKFHAFQCGTFNARKSDLNNRDWDTRYEFPIPVYVFEHPKGIVLFDTGVNHKGLNDKTAWWGNSFADVDIRIKPEDCIPQQLPKIGVKPEDVTHVIMSHLHMDHVGEMESFPKATFVVRRSEIRYAWWPDKHMKEQYPIKDLQNTRDFNFLEINDQVDFDLFGDQSIVLIHTPGHTPGHQSLIVRSADSERPKLLTGDATHLQESINGQLPCANLIWSVPDWFVSVQRLRYYESIGYDLWFGHDMENWKAHGNLVVSPR